jgi:hypothetical protein
VLSRVVICGVVLTVVGGLVLVVGGGLAGPEVRMEAIARDYFERVIRTQSVVANTYTLTVHSMRNLDYDISALEGCANGSYVVISVVNPLEKDRSKLEYRLDVTKVGC